MSDTNQKLATLSSMADLQQAFLICRRANRSMAILGGPGCGKTEGIMHIARTMGREVLPAPMDGKLDDLPEGWAPKVIHDFASNMSGEDLKGIPYRAGDVIKWSIPENLRQLAEGDVYFMDEFTNPFDRSMEGMMQNIGVGERMRVGDWIGPPNVTRVFSGNMPEDGNVTFALSPVLSNRMGVYQFLGPDPVNEWIPWFLEHGGHPIIATAIRMEPTILNQYDADEYSCPTPRAWYSASQALNAVEFVAEQQGSTVSDSTRMRHVASYVGDSAALKLEAVFALRDKIIPFSEIVKDPLGARIPSGKDPAVLFLTVTQLAARTKPNVWKQVAQYVERLPLEMQPVVVTPVLTRHPELEQTGEYVEYTVRTAALRAA